MPHELLPVYQLACPNELLYGCCRARSAPLNRTAPHDNTVPQLKQISASHNQLGGTDLHIYTWAV